MAMYPQKLPMLATPENCSGRTFIVTGANTGLGYEAAKHLVSQKPAKVILAVRNLDAGNKAKETIEKDTGVTGIIDTWQLDLSSYDSVRAFAKQAATLERLDSVIANAGVAISKKALAEGHNLALTVNVISTFFMVLLLYPKLSETARKHNVQTRMAVVGSSYPYMNKDAWDAVKDDPLVKIDAMDDNIPGTYPLTKMLDIQVVRELAPQIPVSQTGVIMNVICPGLCQTELIRHTEGDQRAFMLNHLEKNARTSEMGSRTLIHGALAGPETHGRYLEHADDGEANMPEWAATDRPGATGAESQRRSWEVVKAELEKIEPGCLDKVLAL